jgi:Flp pilus assembly pilin Flp
MASKTKTFYQQKVIMRRSKMKKIQRFFKDESGAELLEIAAYAAIFIVVAIVGLNSLGPALSGFFSGLAAQLGVGS